MYLCMYLESLRIFILHKMGINVPEDSKLRVKMSFVFSILEEKNKSSVNVSKLIYMYIIAKAYCIQCSLQG